MEEVFEEKDIDKIAKKVLKTLKPGDVVAFSGPLSAGKTRLIQSIMRSMNYYGKVTSPTFVLEKNYPVDHHGITEVVHLDFYRLNEDALKSFGWQEYLNQKDTLTLIEWSERAQNLLPDNIKKITLDIIDDKLRRITYNPDSVN